MTNFEKWIKEQLLEWLEEERMEVIMNAKSNYDEIGESVSEAVEITLDKVIKKVRELSE